jgi:putative hydrolase of the HAD superfamily
MTKYKHLFFDLDHTLWDFDTNATHTLQQLFRDYQLDKHFQSYEHFYTVYQPINVSLWEKYRRNNITKQFLNTERFYQPMLAVGYDNRTIAEQFAKDFITISPLQTALLPNVIEVLDYLKQKYTMHIITNGFRETQQTKLEKSGLAPYFSRVYISEMIGAQKPERDFFDYAIKSSNARKAQSLVIGDNLEADVLGAVKAGIHAIYFNPSQQSHNQQPTFEIHSLLQLKEIL